MPKSVNHWFSLAVELPVFVLYSAPDRIKLNKPAKVICTKLDDQSKTFLSSAPFHVINEASLRDVKDRVLKRHPGKTSDDFKIDAT